MNSTMNKRAVYLLGLILISITLLPLSCAYDNEMTYMNDQIIALNNRVHQLQESIEKVNQDVNAKIDTKVDTQLGTINSNQADMMVNIDQLKEDIKALEGRVEDNEYIIKGAVEKDLSQQDSMHSELEKLANLVPRIEKLETVIKQQGDYLGLEPAKTGPPVQQGVESPKEQAAVSQGQMTGETAAYDLSLSQYRNENYDQALEGFKSFLIEYPNSDLADNAQFWIGECYMALKQYDLAILAYQEVIKKYPKANKVPNAMLRQAVAWQEHGDKTSATILLKQLIKQYPGSSEAKIAETKLKTIH
jgi:tol-pal system protein YbgF